MRVFPRLRVGFPKNRNFKAKARERVDLKNLPPKGPLAWALGLY